MKELRPIAGSRLLLPPRRRWRPGRGRARAGSFNSNGYARSLLHLPDAPTTPTIAYKKHVTTHEPATLSSTHQTNTASYNTTILIFMSYSMLHVLQHAT